MDTLKSLTQTLFKLSGSQAMPTDSIVQLQLPASDTPTNYTAPSDGYVCLRAVNSVDASVVQVETTKNRLLSLVPVKSTMQFGGAYLPVKKGEIVSIIFRYTSPGDSALLFIPTVGAS